MVSFESGLGGGRARETRGNVVNNCFRIFWYAVHLLCSYSHLNTARFINRTFSAQEDVLQDGPWTHMLLRYEKPGITLNLYRLST